MNIILSVAVTVMLILRFPTEVEHSSSLTPNCCKTIQKIKTS